MYDTYIRKVKTVKFLFFFSLQVENTLGLNGSYMGLSFLIGTKSMGLGEKIKKNANPGILIHKYTFCIKMKQFLFFKSIEVEMG